MLVLEVVTVICSCQTQMILVNHLRVGLWILSALFFLYTT